MQTELPLPKMLDFVTYRVGDVNYDTSWIEDRGEVIYKYVCDDGIIILMLEAPLESSFGTDNNSFGIHALSEITKGSDLSQLTKKEDGNAE